MEFEQFIYDKADFERDIMCWVAVPPAKEMKRMIDVDFATKPKCFRNTVYRRILNYKTKTGRWWVEGWKLLTPYQQQQEQEELIAIWKMGIDLCRNFYIQCYEDKHPDEEEDEEGEVEDGNQQRALDFHFYECLEKFEGELEKEEINEQQFITRCNNMRDHKKQLENLLRACVCSTMCRHNQAYINGNTERKDVVRFVCMPCGFL